MPPIQVLLCSPELQTPVRMKSIGLLQLTTAKCIFVILHATLLPIF